MGEDVGQPCSAITNCVSVLAEASVWEISNSDLWQSFDSIPTEAVDKELESTVFCTSIAEAAVSNYGCRVAGACHGGNPQNR